MLTDLLIKLEKVLSATGALGLAASFLGGILVSFSPCIYPLIPITVGVVGASSVSSRRQGFLRSFVFVLGISLTYTILGLAAGLTGRLISRFFVNPAAYFVLFLLFCVLGLSLFDIVKIKIFSFSHDYRPKNNLFSLLVLGALSGLALIPCAFPVLGAILAMISLKQNVVYGAAALFCFSLGYGVILIVLGTFTSLVARLPKSGSWLIIVKRVLGAVLMVVAVYFLRKFILLVF